MPFTDDLLIFLTSPLISTPNLLRLEVNIAKTAALNISVPTALVDRLKSHFPFSWASNAIPYLGIKLPAKMENIFSANYPPIFRKIEEELKAWSKCGLSWLGRINAVKMTLLPCLLYLFRSLPILLQKKKKITLESSI